MLKNSLESNKLTSPNIQKDIVCACAMKVNNAILKELEDSYFAILVDESHDVSTRINDTCSMLHRQAGRLNDFFGLIYITDIKTLTLLAAIEAILPKHGLSLSNLR